jgi:branched-chain amino acid transport system substrate-binding protein
VRVASTHDLPQLELAELRTALKEAILGGRYETPLGAVSFTSEGEINQAEFYVARITTDGQTGSFARLR